MTSALPSSAALAIAAVGLLSCSASSSGPDQKWCVEDRCAYLPPGVGLEGAARDSLSGGLQGLRGEWKVVTGNRAHAHWVFQGGIGAEIQAVRNQSGDLFDVVPTLAGTAPKLSVRPTGTPMTLFDAPVGDLEISFRSPVPSELSAVQFYRASSGTKLDIDVHVLTAAPSQSIQTAVAQASKILGLKISYKIIKHTIEEKKKRKKRRTYISELATLDMRTRAAIPVFLMHTFAGMQVAQTSSSPISPFVGEGAILLALGVPRNRPLGEILAHELGHALGLQHLNERNGAVFEGLGDTAICLETDDAAAEPDLGGSDCRVARENLMFYRNSGAALSEQQRKAISWSPFLR